MKFQWYVIDCDEGTVTGSNDVDEVRQFLTSDRYVLLTAQHGQYYCGSTVEKEVEALQSSESEDDDEDEEDESEDGDDEEDEDEDDLI